MSIVRKVEPAHQRRAHEGVGEGEGHHHLPVSERFCQGEVREAVWEGPAVPGVLDGNIHGEKMMGVSKAESWSDLVLDGCSYAFLHHIYRPFPPIPSSPSLFMYSSTLQLSVTSHAHLHRDSANKLIFLEQ